MQACTNVNMLKAYLDDGVDCEEMQSALSNIIPLPKQTYRDADRHVTYITAWKKSTEGKIILNES